MVEPTPGTAAAPDAPPPVQRRLMVHSLLRASLTGILVMVLYYVLPYDRGLDTIALLEMLGGLLLFGLLSTWHVREIIQSDFPRVRAVEALSTTIPLFLVIFATAYFLIEESQPGSFNQTLSRTDALYFTVTVFSTVGLGDILPLTQVTRILTMIQMLVDLIAIGLLARVILGAVQVGLQRRASGGARPPGRDTPSDGT